MNDIILWFKRNQDILIKGILFLLATVIIVQMFPRTPRFGYDYQEARPWTYDDLIAPFDFAILKTQDEIEKERVGVLEEFRPYFTFDTQITSEQIDAYESAFFRSADSLLPNDQVSVSLEMILIEGRAILDSVFNRGIIFLHDTLLQKPSDFEIQLIHDRVVSTYELQELFTISEAYQFVNNELEEMEARQASFLRPLLEQALIHNVYYNEVISAQARQDALDSIPLTRGMVQEGEKIISKGELISPVKYQAIESFKAEYLRLTGETSNRYMLFFGRFLLVSISMVVLVLFLLVFRKDVFVDNRRIILILLTLLLMITITGLVIRYNSSFLYVLPVCIVPIVIRAFFDNRLALYVHINTIILIGFLIPRSFEFVFLQFIAGIIAILSMVSLRRRSQLFSTVVLIFITYCAVYLGLTLAHGGSFSDLRLMDFGYMSVSAVLTLLAYPIIYLFERLFGMATDFSLLELADTNNDLLRQLGMLAPGTFQHSLQVANLSEESIYAIGGNALLTRTGALYHDIGKMTNPIYFTENQTSGFNPHDALSFKKSASIIIDHVSNGIDMARKNNLPEYIIDFIRTHHGTTTARYFYTMHVKDNPTSNASKKDFIYPGPKPFSKETAVVMMADSVEAASRSLVQPDEQQINKLVDQIIESQIEEKQFENAPITFKDIDTVKKILKQRLVNIHHIRVAYPDMN